jgi:membrane protein implicated in regulation of membrane protease activity
MTAQKDSGARRERREMLRNSNGTGAYLVREAAEFALLIAALAIVNLFIKIPMWVLVGLPIAKAFTSAGFYALFLRRAFRRPARGGAEELIGRTVKACTRLHPGGQIKVDGEIWSARSADGNTIAPRDAVEIVGVRGNTVLVERTDIDE